MSISELIGLSNLAGYSPKLIPVFVTRLCPVGDIHVIPNQIVNGVFYQGIAIMNDSHVNYHTLQRVDAIAEQLNKHT
jgi:hypothetical protein